MYSILMIMARSLLMIRTVLQHLQQQNGNYAYIINASVSSDGFNKVVSLQLLDKAVRYLPMISMRELSLRMVRM